MAASWLLQAIYASLLSQSALGPDKRATDTATFVTTQTPYGDLRGVRKPTVTNVSVDSFLGIPFALPPIGARRFSRPEPPVKWTGVRYAYKFANECFQRGDPENMYRVSDKPVNQSEDCLHLNVYVPSDIKPGESLAVMVWIHGGSYYLGAGSHYDGSDLAATGVIVVTINYRLDIFGFLSNDGDELPGNYGMLDQIMALKWVKENIHSFRGDPGKVTIFGESSGSTSVSLLVLSPLAAGLFNRAIMESGVSLSSWSFVVPPSRLTPSMMFSIVGNKIGCMDSDESKRLQCFRNVDAAVLMNASVAVMKDLNADMVFAPRIETAFSFLPDLPINLLTKNKFNRVDTIRGFNTDESGYFIDQENDGFSKEEFVKYSKGTFEPYALIDRDKIINELENSYVGNQTDRFAIRYAAVRARSDFEFNGPTVIEANIESQLSKANNHYLYEFQYRPSYSQYPSWLTATHGDELPFVFGVHHREFKSLTGDKNPSKDDILVWNQMKTLWSNFAQYGDPTKTVPVGAVPWKPYDTQAKNYLKIDTKSRMLAYDNTRATTVFERILPKLQTTYKFDSIVG